MFLMGLHLPFCYLVRDILDFLGLALAQLVPNSWRILMACCVAWRQVLEPMGDEYPDLIAYEFLYIHGVHHLDGNLYSF